MRRTAPAAPWGLPVGFGQFGATGEDPFEPAARIDENALADLVATAVRMMDNVIDISVS